MEVQFAVAKVRKYAMSESGDTLEMIERCSGHDGTYGVKTGTYAAARKIAKPVVERMKKCEAAHYSSDCPMAGAQVAGLADRDAHPHPIQLLRQAYGI